MRSKKGKLFLVDGSALVHRAYHAYPSLTNREGKLINVVYGVGSMLISALKEEEPDYVAVAWDVKGPTFRHEEYIAYKANRPKTDEALLEQIPLTKEMIASFGIKELEQSGYEADDLIGSLARKFYDQVESIIILTGDQDLMQLVNGKVKVLLPARGKVPAKLYGEEEVRERYGVEPKQIVDYKALVGDPSDNIPGVAGIGPKTAAKLLQEFGSLEEIYRMVKQGSGFRVQGSGLNERLVEKLREGEESAFLSQRLARIKTDLDLGVKLEDLEFEGLEREEAREFLEKMRFKSLLRRVFGETKKSNDKQLGLF